MKKSLIALTLIVSSLMLSACNRDAQVASENLTKSADMFELNRRIVFYNGFTGEYILSIQGLCSIKKDNHDDQLEVTCKTGPNTFKKHFLGISNNVTYFVEQVDPAKADPYHYDVIFKPQLVVPNIHVKVQ
jgi:predicted small secreted protein